MRMSRWTYVTLALLLVVSVASGACKHQDGLSMADLEADSGDTSSASSPDGTVPPEAAEQPPGTDGDTSKGGEPEPCTFAESWSGSAQFGSLALTSRFAENFGFLTENSVDKSVWLATTQYLMDGKNKIVLRHKAKGSDTWDLAAYWTPPANTYAEVRGIASDDEGTVWVLAQLVKYPAWTDHKAILLKLPLQGSISGVMSEHAIPSKLGMRNKELWITGDLIDGTTLPYTFIPGVLVYNSVTNTTDQRKSIMYPGSQKYVSFQGKAVEAPNGKMWLPGQATDKDNIKHGIILEEDGDTFKIIADFGENDPDQQWNVTALAFDGDTFWASLVVNVNQANKWTKQWRVGSGNVSDPEGSFAIKDEFRVIVPGMSSTPSFVALHPNETVFVMGLAKNINSVKDGQPIWGLWNSLTRAGNADGFSSSDLFMPSNDKNNTNQAVDLLIDSDGNVWTSHMAYHSTNFFPGEVFVRELSCN